MKYSSKDFNFFEKYNKSRLNAQRRIELLAILTGFVLFVCICGVVVSYALRLQMQAIQYEIDSHVLFLESPATKSKLAKNEELNERLNEINKYNNATARLDGYINNSSSINTFLLQSIANNITTNTSVITIGVSGDAIEINGGSDNEASIAQFEHNMAGLQFVDTVHVSTITKNEDTYDFVMSIKMKEVASIESIGNE